VSATAALRLASGDGVVARRPGALLFSPAPAGATLAAVFDAAPDDAGAIAAVKAAVVDAGFDVAPFGVVTWSASAISLLVFGAVEIVTSLSTVPMISAAGSGTWVEHQVADPLTDGPVVVAVNAGVDEASDLRLGVVRAGGFQLELTPVAAGATPVVSAAAAPPTGSTLAGVPVVPIVAVNPEAADPGPVDDVPGPVDDVTVIAEEPPVEAAEPVADGPLVEAAMCTAGHANRPLTASCWACGLAVTDNAQEWKLISQPVVGRIVLGNGDGVDLDGVLVLGRRPTLDDDGAQAVVVSGDDVSRNHVRIAVQGWDVVATDLSSRNGTFLQVGSDPTPIRLDPGVEQLLESGTAIHLGSPDVAVRFERSW